MTPLEKAFIKEWAVLCNVDLGGILKRSPDTVRYFRAQAQLKPYRWWAVPDDYSQILAKGRIAWHVMNLAQ